MMRLRGLIVLAAACVVAPADATAQFFAGRAIEDSTRVPLARLWVHLLRGNASLDSTRTDANGMFQLVATGPGVYQLGFGAGLKSIVRGPIDTVTSDAVLQREFAVPVLRRSAQLPFAIDEVDEPVMVGPKPGAPKYPTNFDWIGPGEVIVRFVVMPDSSVERSTITILKTTRSEFAQSVKDYLAIARYSPGKVGGIPVRSEVMQPFVFSIK